MSSEYRDYFPGIMRPRREVEHSAPTMAEVKNKWNCTSTPLSRRGQGRLSLYYFYLYCKLVAKLVTALHSSIQNRSSSYTGEQ
jgi:hypothetical protein